jgi:ankyrin repeat protein
MRDRSEMTSVAVMMLRVVVFVIPTVVCVAMLSQVGDTALLLACCKGHIDVARWLVSEAGSDARSERNNVGRCDDAACACVVVDRRCGVHGDVLSQGGHTALLLACYNGHIDVARWLVSEAGSDARSERNNVGRCLSWF